MRGAAGRDITSANYSDRQAEHSVEISKRNTFDVEAARRVDAQGRNCDSEESAGGGFCPRLRFNAPPAGLGRRSDFGILLAIGAVSKPDDHLDAVLPTDLRAVFQPPIQGEDIGVALRFN